MLEAGRARADLSDGAKAGAREDGSDARPLLQRDDARGRPVQSTTGAGRSAGPVWVYYALLVVPVLAVSTAGVVFASMSDVPAVTLASWRLQATAVLLSGPAAWQVKCMTAEQRIHFVGHWTALVASGLALAAHFGLWVYGLQHTSLVHSLVLVCATPVVLALWTLLVDRANISRAEIAGVALGALGAAAMALGSSAATAAAHRAGNPPGVLGDAASFGAAVAMAVYTSLGQRVRRDVPWAAYAGPVTAVGALALSAAACVVDGAGVLRGGPGGVFGYLDPASGHLAHVAYLSCVPGLLGHTMVNFLLAYVTPLSCTLALTLEPVVGGALGWALGLQGAIGPLGAAGGAAVLAAAVVVSVASGRRQARQQREREGGDVAVEVCLEMAVGEAKDGASALPDVVVVDGATLGRHQQGQLPR
ncbi:unnamed protein product [Pedinophyceae sp. YPF-701]|nr:unnamed protein product [Pedinophyceae sp. YPF-701]